MSQVWTYYFFSNKGFNNDKLNWFAFKYNSEFLHLSKSYVISFIITDFNFKK